MIAVTGASGGLGRRIIARLASVRPLVRDPNSVAGGVKWDLENADAVSFEGIDCLVHAAAFIPPSMDASHASRCLEQNGAATARLFDSAVRAGVRTFVYVSAGNAYAPTAVPARETDALYPSERATYYLTSKLAGEVFADHIARASNARLVILRASAIYGTNKPGVVPLFASRLRNGDVVTIRDGGRYRADLVHVDDVASMVARAATDATLAGVYNVGSGHASSMLEIAETLVRLLGRDRSLVSVEPEKATGSVGYPPLDIDKARAIGFVPRSLQDGLRAYLEAYP